MLVFSYGFYFCKLTCIRKLNANENFVVRVPYYTKIKSKFKLKIRNIKLSKISLYTVISFHGGLNHVYLFISALIYILLTVALASDFNYELHCKNVETKTR